MEIPQSMKAALLAWNNGGGVDLEAWVSCEGNFSLAVGYASIFWPDFVEFEDYILRAGFSESSLRGFELEEGTNRQSVEWVMNHIHIADLQKYGCEDLSKDKLIILGNTLKEIYIMKLRNNFPHLSCIVEFYTPKDDDDLIEYQLSFWIRRND